jgi:hypothetical protein
MKNAIKTYFILQNYFQKQKYIQKTKIDTKEHSNRQNITFASETLTLRKQDRKQLNISERKVYRRTLSPAYDNEKENWKILTNKEIYAILKKPTTTETIRLHRLQWFGHVQRMEENRIPKGVLYMNLESKRSRNR